jgi:glycosyltransferase involved in cell wall biosynthesis
LADAVAERLKRGDEGDYWLTLAVLLARLPTQSEVTVAHRMGLLSGGLSVVRQTLVRPRSGLFSMHSFRSVEIAEDGVLVDVDHTSRVEFATGIQRVARETAREWSRAHHPRMVGWTGDRTALRVLGATEAARAMEGGALQRAAKLARWRDKRIVVPAGATYVLPELNVETRSVGRLAAFARFGSSPTRALVFDAIPLTTSEVVDTGMAAKFASYLSAVKFFGRVVAISVAAGVEYSGWRRMLVGSGVAGPEVEVVVLPAGVPGPGVAPVVASPLVLCVGSHEPRKNHGAVLQAAELLWREGLEFSLLFVGGNSWGSDEFVARVERLSAAGRDVRVLHAVDDAVLWGLYRAARFTVFPSLNEGFGLPVVESLSVGTPVVTSSFGSMREIVVAGGGGVLVDPRDDHDVARGMRELLVNDELRERLSVEALARPVRTWADYAADTWTTLTTP